MPLPGRWRPPAVATLGFLLATLVVTYPWPFHLADLGRADNGDGQYAIWNVAWVARTIVADPVHLFDANIFYPRRWTLAYSETNVGAGILAAPVYWMTANPYAAHNFVVLASFVLSGLGMYCLATYLFGDRRAAFVAGLAFAFCPYLFGHLPHIQLLMIAGLPFSLLAFHRLADRPTAGRGALLGLALAVQAIFCAYYGVFAMLLVGLAIVFAATTARRFSDLAYWQAIGVSIVVGAVVVAPVVWPHVVLWREAGFNRPLDAARAYSAGWEMYAASYAFAHDWMMGAGRRSGELLFPGIVSVAFAVSAIIGALRASRRSRELTALYALAALFALWMSFGPQGGLYAVFYAWFPGFTFMRAPSRFGVVFTFAVCVLAAQGIARFLNWAPRSSLVAAAIAVVTVAELLEPLPLSRVPKTAPVYSVLAAQPRGALLELPVYSHPLRHLRTRYMLSSTAHWMPLVGGYSDHIPPDFTAEIPVLADFPNDAAFTVLKRDRVRYVIFHLEAYADQERSLDARLATFGPYLRRVYKDKDSLLYEIVAFPEPGDTEAGPYPPNTPR